MSNRVKLYELPKRCEIVDSTEKAALVDFGDYKHWIPLTAIRRIHVEFGDDAGSDRLNVMGWWVRQNNMYCNVGSETVGSEVRLLDE